jgi:hypothetical protein|eukprot:m.223377 g.223377  ORF g.223377 m.223377 type:complete len:60 (-) comp25844_c0_seq2:2914-3093(-)
MRENVCVVCVRAKGIQASTSVIAKECKHRRAFLFIQLHAAVQHGVERSDTLANGTLGVT